MNQAKIEGGHVGGRILISAASSALAFSSLAGSVILSGQEAKAYVIGNTVVSYTDICVDGVRICNYTDTLGPVLDGPDGDSSRIDLELTGLKYPFNQAQIDIDYNPPLTGPAGPATAFDYVTYKISKTATYNGVEVEAWFDQVSLSFLDGQLNESMTKNVYATLDDLTNSNPIATLYSSGPFVSVSLPGKYKTLWVRDLMLPNGGSIDNVNNGYRDVAVPGPLPILGVGAAFGFSRKLRSRIKASRTAGAMVCLT